MPEQNTSQLISQCLRVGLFDGISNFGCSYFPTCPTEDFGQSGFEFHDIGPKHASLRFLFRGNGEILISGCPNKWSNFRSTDILSGYSDAAVKELFAFTVEHIPTIKKTIVLYTESMPQEDYSDLMTLWKNVQPDLLDKQVDAHLATPWWKFW